MSAAHEASRDCPGGAEAHAEHLAMNRECPWCGAYTDDLATELGIPTWEPGRSGDDLRADARAYVAGTRWTYAKTMAENPHWYVVINKETDHRIEALLTLLHRLGVVRRWHRLPYLTATLDGWDFWRIDPVVNAKPTAVAGWDGEGKPTGWLPDAYRRDLKGTELAELRGLVEAWATEQAPPGVDPGTGEMLSESDHFGVDPDTGVLP
jgi:hypothetical protein